MVDRRLDDNASSSEHRPVTDDLDPREAARARRRDRDALAAHRELMRPGMGKVFKQIQDAQRQAAEGPPRGKVRKGGLNRPP
jgi:hypothetical protein